MKISMTCAAAVALACVGVLPIACGGSKQPAENPTTTSSASGTSEAPSTEASTSASPMPPAALTWKDMNHEQKLDHMKKVVMPKMKEDFVAFDGKKYEKMNCLTCHGAGAKDGSFKMPNPDLPKLSVDGGFKKHMDKTPEITKFMMTKVTGTMASLLGMPAYDPKTQTGFGCFGCHTMSK